MNELALCAGIGGISLGLKRAGFRTICYVERNPYRVSVLRARMRDGYLDDAPIWDDLTTFEGAPWCGKVDIITGGLPCQPFSVSGKMLGEADERYLWPATYQIICDVRPRYILLENVPGLLMGERGKSAPVSRILGDLAEAGYDAEWASITAASFGLPHLRERVFIVAHTRQGRWERLLCGNGGHSLPTNCYRKGEAPDTLGAVFPLISQVEQRMGEPSVFGSNDGLPFRVERLAAIGEAVVPPIAEYIGRSLRRSEHAR